MERCRVLLEILASQSAQNGCSTIGARYRAAMSEFVSVLRCKSWHVWPEREVIERKNFNVKFGAIVLPARLAVLSYVQKSPMEQPDGEDTKAGMKIWGGEVIGPRTIWDGVLAPPEETFSLTLTHRQAHRGEIDICINFLFDADDLDDLPSELVEAIQTSSYSIMSLLNIRLKDFLVPSAPVQILHVLPNGQKQYSPVIAVHCKEWTALSSRDTKIELDAAAGVLEKSPHGDKLRIALELYAAHYNEQHVRVRFLLLVIAMEALAPSTDKHQVVLQLLERWKEELQDAKSKFDADSEEYQSFDALSRELNFRSEDSIRSQIRKLFAGVPCDTPEESSALQRRALKVYDKRSTLVHVGYLPKAELASLENEARELLELLLQHAT